MGGYIGSEKTVALYDSYTKKETDELNESSTRMLLKRHCAEAGLTLVDGSFEEGATVNLKTEVIWQQATGKIFGWFQDAVKTVAAGSTPETSGGIGAGAWVDRTDVTLRGELISQDGSSEVGFKQAGSGAVATNVQNKLREFVSVKDFGAVGDGLVDDTVAFQNAIAYVGANTLRPLALLVPTGQYRITIPLTAGAYVYIIGETRRSIIIFDHANTGLTLTGGIGRLEKLQFTRGNLFTNQGINLYFNAAPEWVLEAVRSSFANVGLQTKDSHLLSLKDCVIDQNVTGYLDEGRDRKSVV